MPLSDSILTRLRHQHEALPELIRDLTEEELKRRINPDKWSAFEQIAHLAAYQVMFIGRLERLTTETTPSFERYVAENDPAFPQYLHTSLQTLLQSIPAKAAEITARLTNLKEPDLLRTGRHPRYGNLTIPQWTQFFLLHEAHHLYAIFMLTQDLRAAGV
ncbi:MAG: DinB family protein [Chitinophagaceae bacterium]|nr:DinB family protein [Chitinophagaceae bacterium]